MKYRVKHLTTYRYADEFSSCHSQVHLVPRETDRQTVESFDLLVDPAPEVFDRHEDSFGNQVESFSIHVPTDVLKIEAVSVVEIKHEKIRQQVMSRGWEDVREVLASTAPPLEALPLLFKSPHVALSPAAAEYAAPSFVSGRSVQEAGTDLMRRIYADFKFDSKATDVGTSVDEVLQRRRGVCQDFAHLMIACVRSMGLAARYVSGYLLTEPVPGKPRLIGADASHAWCAVWCPDAGWVEYDPTNELSPCDKHITLAWGRDFGDVSPVRGVVLGGGGHKVVVAVDVDRIK